MIDVLIAGAGPAGLATALYAARAGLETVVLEPRQYPIDKACGEGLMPGAVRALTELSVDLSGHRIAGIRYLRGPYRAQAAFGSGPGLGVRRTCLQQALVDRTRAAGVRIEHGSVASITQDAQSITAGGIRARYLVAADGLHSPIRRELGLARPATGARRWGLRQHFAVSPWTDHVEVHWARHSEAYLTPVSDGVVGVAVLSGEPGPLDEQLRQFPAVQAALAGAEPLGPVRGAGPLRQRTSHRVAGRVLLVGDAAGYVDALTGEGIAVALGCAAVLVDCLARDRPADYERAWRHASLRYRALTASLLWARQYRPVNTAIVPAAVRAPWLFQAAVNQLAG